MTAESHPTEHRRSRSWFGWGLAAVFVLFLGGCVAVLGSVNQSLDGLSGPADEDDYSLTLTSCEVVDGTPVGSGTIRSMNAELRSFRVEVWAYDNETAEIVGNSSRGVAANTGQAEPFELLLFDLGDMTRTTVPGSVSCAARVFYSS